MDLEQIKKLLDGFSTLPESELDFFINDLKPVAVSKGENLVSPGDVFERISFVRNGLFKCSSYSPEGDEHIESFVTEGEVMTDYAALINKTPSRIYICALEDSEVWLSSPGISDVLHSRNPLWYEVGLKITQILYIKLSKRIEELTKFKTIDRYHSFRSEQRHIFSLLQQADIASYLGVTPTSLSRLLKDSKEDG